LVTSHGSYFFTSGLEIFLGQLQIKIEADLLFVQCRKLSPKITRFLQYKPYQSTENKKNKKKKFSDRVKKYRF